MQAELSHKAIGLLQSCRHAKDTAQTKFVYSFLCEHCLDSNPVLLNHLVLALVQCQSLHDACHVFDRLPFSYQSEYPLNAILSQYIDNDAPRDALRLYNGIQQTGKPIGRATFLVLLNACTRLRDLEIALELHAAIIKRDILSGSAAVGNRLVNMYAKCGLVTEALQVLRDLPVRNPVSWNALIAGCVHYGYGDKVGSLLQQMMLDGISPDSSTFASFLKSCSINGSLVTGQEMHAETTKRGSERELFVGSALVTMYMGFRLHVEAHHVFENLPARDAVSWAALIAGYADQGLVEEMEYCFQKMLNEGITPDYVTFICSLKACAVSGALQTGRQLHAELSRRGFETELCVGSALMDVYMDCGLHEEACQVFQGLLVRDSVCWNSMIAGYAEYGLSQKAWNSFQQMLLDGIAPDSVTLISSLRACSNSKAVEIGFYFHVEAVKRGMERDLQVQRALVDLYIECELLFEAHHVFEWLTCRCDATWSALIAGYIEHESAEKAIWYFKQMMHEVISLGSIALVRMLKACSTSQALEMGRLVHTEATRRGLEREIHVCSILVDMYTMCNSLMEARQVFDTLPVRNAVAWNAMVIGYADHGLGNEAVLCCQEMLLEGEIPDVVTIVCALKACGSLQRVEAGQHVYAETVKRGFERELHVENTLVDMYSKCGLLVDAQQVFNMLPSQDDVVSWAALIAGYTDHGFPEEAVSCFEQMQNVGVSPDSIVFVCSLKACGITGAIEIGQCIHAEIVKRGSEGEIHVGSTLVDMYGNSGLLEDACDVFYKLPAKSIILWTSMINAFGNNNEGKLAIQCFENMESHGLVPTSITFVCLLVACSHSNLVCEGERLFKLMTERYGIKPAIDHFGCMVDLFTRSGLINEAERLVAGMQCSPSSIIIYGLLSACKIYGKLELGQLCFHQLLEMNLEDSSAYLLMADIYSSTARWSDAQSVEQIRISAGSKKKPGSAFIEVNQSLIEFVVGANQSQNIFKLSKTLAVCMRADVYMPNLDSVLGHPSEQRCD